VPIAYRIFDEFASNHASGHSPYKLVAEQQAEREKEIQPTEIETNDGWEALKNES
jgi:hypothetical protein